MTNNAISKVSVQAFIRSGEAQELIAKTMKDNTDDFTVSLLSVVNSNPVLQECDPITIIKSGFIAAALGLPVTPGLDFAYIIPYRNKKKDPATGKDIYVMEAQFQIGAKGFKQLALRTEKYKIINDSDVREYEYKGVNRLTGEYDFNWIDNEGMRKEAAIVGYLAYIELHSGYRKALYMTIEELTAHAKKYSKQFQKGGGQWADTAGGGFDNMARKTVVKLLISRHGIMSTSLQKAMLADQAVIDDEAYKYIDNMPDGSEPIANTDDASEEPTDA